MTLTNRLVIVGVLVAALGVTVALRRDRTAASTAAAATPAAATPAAAIPRLVDVGADSCIPCKAMVPVLEELRREYAGRLSVEFIDAWKFPARADAFNVSIIPTQIFIDASGRELHRHQGFISKAEIVETWRHLGVRFDAAGQR